MLISNVLRGMVNLSPITKCDLPQVPCVYHVDACIYIYIHFKQESLLKSLMDLNKELHPSPNPFNSAQAAGAVAPGRTPKGGVRKCVGGAQQH